MTHPMQRRVLVGLIAFTTFPTWAVETAQPPADWRDIPAMSQTCQEAVGTYQDPNTWIWERENPATGEKFNGRRHAAWVAFSIPAAQVRSEEGQAGSRTFKLSIDEARSLSIAYMLDGVVVASRTFQASAWSCTPNGLVITKIDREGVVLDKLPNKGRTTERAIVRVKDRSIYVHTARETRARVLGVVPQSFQNASWQVFQPVE